MFLALASCARASIKVILSLFNATSADNNSVEFEPPKEVQTTILEVSTLKTEVALLKHRVVELERQILDLKMH